MIEHPNREDCYIARLLVRKVSPQDSKKYFLAVENIHGEDRYAVALSVKGINLILLQLDFMLKNVFWGHFNQCSTLQQHDFSIVL